MTRPRRDQAPSELWEALRACRGAFLAMGGMSALLNILMLAGSFFMMLVYDRVLPSRSLSTLAGLLVMVAAAYLFQALLELIRSRMLIRIGSHVDTALGARVYDVVTLRALRTRALGDGLEPVRDLDQIKGFLSGPGPTAFFDLPFLVLFLAVLFGFHPLIGMTALAGAIILLVLTFVTDRMIQAPTREASKAASARNAMAEASRRNAEVMQAMGMTGQGRAAWTAISQQHRAAQQQLAQVAGRMGAITRILRLLLQSVVLATGAYLVVDNKASGGVIIASSVLTARALAPVETVIANWKGLVAARQAWTRLTEMLNQVAVGRPVTALPAPTQTLALEHVSVGPPGIERITVMDVSFSLRAGEAMAIIGPSASGKSSLIRAIVGVWSAARGRVRIDGAALDQWDPQVLGKHIGYLPQDVELFQGTVAQNISRFEAGAPPEAVLEAARMAGVHELILRLPSGYETEIGTDGSQLSAGQRQRLALARALYRNPFLVVLDEPNSNLDAEGEFALAGAIAGIRARGAIAIVVAHRPSALANIDLVLHLADGRVQDFGPKADVLKKLMPGPAKAGAAGVA